MRTTFVALASGLSLAVFYAATGAQQMPKSGNFNLHSGWKSTGETTKAAENRIYGFGSFWGVAFNDKGSGPLHSGPAVCSYVLDLVNGVGPGKGQCSWGDVDGDKIFTDYSGSLTAAGQFDGMNQITGGTGKYSGIQGKAPFQCKAISANGHWACTQQFEYRLP